MQWDESGLLLQDNAQQNSRNLLASTFVKILLTNVHKLNGWKSANVEGFDFFGIKAIGGLEIPFRIEVLAIKCLVAYKISSATMSE